MSDSQATILAYVISLVLMFSYVVRIAILRRRVLLETANCSQQSQAVKNAVVTSELKPSTKIKAS